MTKIKISNIFAGKEEFYKKGDKTIPSSYKKQKQIEDVFVNSLGLENDNQSNREFHGGAEQALCVFCQNEYEYLKKTYGFSLQECSFGENITLLNVSDKDFCIGDIFKCGEAIFQISLPRSPCYKIDMVLGTKNLCAKMIKDYKSGFYLRVLKEGFINKDFGFELMDRKNPKYTILFVNECFANPKQNQQNIKELLECEELGAKFKKTLEKKLREEK